MTLCAAICALSAGGCSARDSDARRSSNLPSVTIGEQREGEATYYGATGDGACMLGPSPDDLDVAAVNQPDWSGSSLCGACADVNGPKGKVSIRIVDLCPECKTGDLDMSPQAFDVIADHAAGRVPITWKLVSCDVSGPVRYKYKDGANAWWTAVQVQNHRLPVVRMEFAKSGNTYESMSRTDYNYFLTETGFGTGPVRVRVTAIDGQVLEDDLPQVQELLTVEGNGQF